MVGGPGFDVDTAVLRRLAQHLCAVDAPRIRAVVDEPLLGQAIISREVWGHVEFLDLGGVADAYEAARGQMAERCTDVADHLCPGMSDLLDRTAATYTASDTHSRERISDAGRPL